ncbi:protein-L-isoaspartate O-methyltransferase [uncultured Sphingomonas sp.]|uniref:protein-L-isoaspartate O-methyltransferase family protein n=1 Tax=uncultured Sphingomonas sp. TaxID=158754 RepID=UPI0025FE5027|nr:protein-L-isoaspartate O-methyltransferase [uncultured Sphingomonas sp.]
MNKTPQKGQQVTEHNFEQMRRAMVASQLRTTAVNDPRVVEAMGEVPRERFVPAGQVGQAYLDISLPLGDGRALASPMVLGRLLTEARVRQHDRALVIGASSGYSAAVLAKLAGSVVALEQGAAPAVSADNVTGVQGALTAGWPASGPYDLILFDGAIEYVPAEILDQLVDGGRIAAPVLEGGVTRLAIGRKAGGSFAMISFADAEAPVLPGFVKPKQFTF